LYSVGLSLALCGLLAMLAACSAPGPLPPRLHPSGITLPLPEPDFAAYAEASARKIGLAQDKIRRPLDPTVIAERAPFELAPRPRRCPERRGVLLVHGLGASPFQMHDLAHAFAQTCYRARAILLPGHGTVPGDLATVDADDWRAAVQAGAASFKSQVDDLVLVGFGLGASLALDYALTAPAVAEPPLAGLVLLAPDLPPAGLGAASLQRLRPLLADPNGWRAIHADADPVGYESLPEHAMAERRRLIAGLASAPLPPFPLFVAVAAEDATIDPQAVQAWFCTVPTGPRQLLWYRSTPGYPPTCPFASERAPGGGPEVLDLAHPALPIAPGNPHYGVAGDYVSCSHYEAEQTTPAWFICADRAIAHQAAVRFGEISARNLQGHVIRRLTWNPDFVGLSDAMLRFLDRNR
jgi:esterase/lipase